MEDYCVEVAYSLPDLVKQVQKMMEIGYKPVGGITITDKREFNWKERRWEYFQAMTKENEPR